MENEERSLSIPAMFEYIYSKDYSIVMDWIKFANYLIERYVRIDPNLKPRGEDIVQDCVEKVLCSETDGSCITESVIVPKVKNYILGTVKNVCKRKDILISFSSIPLKYCSRNEEDDELTYYDPIDPSSREYVSDIESKDSFNVCVKLLENEKRFDEIKILNGRLEDREIEEADLSVENPTAANRRLINFLNQHKNIFEE